VIRFTPRPLHLRGKSPGNHWIGGWLGPRAGLDAMAKRKIPYPCRVSNSGRPARSLVTILTELFRLHLLVLVATQSRAYSIIDCWNTGTSGSNPARGMDGCCLFSMLYYPMWVETSRWAIPRPKCLSTCQMDSF